ncbi:MULTISPECIES: O-antigen ligase family protein [Pseudomonas]|uniref:O-antigen ligase family protein n=1 Tax=Pseudomonas TaxID=286 RepID=UPI0015A5D268|nr:MULTISPECIES: O-antigen ligase family protein [Pseudomonas]
MYLQAANKVRNKKWFAIRQTIFFKNPNSCLLYISLLTLSASWLLPNHSYPLSSILQDLTAFLAISIALLSLPKLQIPTESLVVFFVALIPIAQFFSGTIKLFGDALNSSLFIFLLCISIVIGHSLRQKEADCKTAQERISYYILASGILCTYIQIRQWLNIPGNIYIVDLPPAGRPFANFAQPNNLATFLCLSLASNWLLFKENKLSREFAFFLALILIFGIALTQSRTSWITLPLLFTLLAANGSKKTALFLAIYYIFISTLTPSISKILLLESESILSRAVQSQRLLIWKPLFEMTLHSPLVGYGWNQIPVVQLEYSDKIKTGFIFNYSHNLFLDLLLYNGIPLGLTLIALIFIGYALRIKQNKTGTNTYSLVCITAIGIHCQLEFPHAYAYFIVPFGLFWGLSSSSKTILNLPRPVPILLSALIIATTIKAWTEYVEVEQNFLTLRMQHAKIITAEPQAMSSGIFFSELKAYYSFINSPEDKMLNKSEIDKAEFISHRFPFDYTMKKLIRILNKNNLPSEAKMQEEKLKNITSGDP